MTPELSHDRKSSGFRRNQNSLGVLVRVSLLRSDTMTKATLIRTTFNWGWLKGLEVQSIIIKGQGSIQAGMVQEELRVLHFHLKAARRRLLPRR